MAYRDLREFIRALEQNHELKRIPFEVDPIFEITEFADRAVKQGGREYSEGFVFPNGIASYIHLHFLSNPALARNMLNS